MAADAVLNIRLPKELKAHGNQVLERNGKSISQVVRDLYEYMESEQDLPSFAKKDAACDKYAERRELLKDLQLNIEIPDDVDLKSIRHERVMKKYGERA